MCIAIFKPAHVLIPDEHLDNSFYNNDDGAGFAFVENDEIVIRKGFFKYEHFMEHYKKHEHKPMIVHFRIKTHGDISKENCHPFRISRSYVAAHNGVLHSYSTKEKSDTRFFVDDVLKPMAANGTLENRRLKKAVEECIGKNNKVVILKRNGKPIILNEDEGIWKDKVWYSNETYQWKWVGYEGYEGCYSGYYPYYETPRSASAYPEPGHAFGYKNSGLCKEDYEYTFGKDEDKIPDNIVQEYTQSDLQELAEWFEQLRQADNRKYKCRVPQNERGRIHEKTSEDFVREHS